MTITQLEYVVAVDTWRHFRVAAEHCFVTQPTLSMQIQKLEDELGVKIFDRTKQPVLPTEVGSAIVAQARVVLREAGRIQQLIDEHKDVMAGEIRLGIIPTLAPYLLPALYGQLRSRYPAIHLMVKEAKTKEIIHDLKNNRLDCGLVVTPLKEPSIREEVLFYEELYVYVSAGHALQHKTYVLPDELLPEQLWLLEEGHCFRNQVLNLCELQKQSNTSFRYETGNLDTLKRMVDHSEGITILPELAVRQMDEADRRQVKQLGAPSPVREVSLVTHRDHLKTRLLTILKEEVIQLVPPAMLQADSRRVVEVGY
jgi:LysR family hydrogen peroxide-inducible transcriptional activator